MSEHEAQIQESIDAKIRRAKPKELHAETDPYYPDAEKWLEDE